MHKSLDYRKTEAAQFLAKQGAPLGVGESQPDSGATEGMRTTPWEGWPQRQR